MRGRKARMVEIETLVLYICGASIGLAQRMQCDGDVLIAADIKIA